MVFGYAWISTLGQIIECLGRTKGFEQTFNGDTIVVWKIDLLVVV